MFFLFLSPSIVNKGLLESDDLSSGFVVEWNQGSLIQFLDLQSSLSSLKEGLPPEEVFPEEMIDSLESGILSIKIALSLSFILGLQSLFTLTSYMHKAWFFVYLIRINSLLGILFGLHFLSLGIQVTFLNGILGLPILGLGILEVCASILSLFEVQSWKKREEEMNFSPLKNQSFSDEDGNVEVKNNYSRHDRWYLHVLIIVFLGMIIGNIIYIPIFLIQKNFSNEFSILILLLICVLGIFYIRNYYQLGHDPNKSLFANSMVMISFLLYRIAKNITAIVLVSISIILSVTILISLLNLNTEIWKKKSSGWLETTEDL
jgi:hypothetical protein